MRKAQVLVTITAEAVVDVPAGVEDVERYCHDRVTLAWGDLDVDRVVQHPSIAVDFFMLPEPVVEAPAEEETAEPVEATEPAEALVDAPLAIGATPGTVAAAVEGLMEGAAEAPPAEEAHEAGIEAAGPVPESVESAALAEPLPVAEHVLSREELLSLFSDPLYTTMVRAAVRDRALPLLESIVGEVIAELEPLLRRHLDRHRAPNA